MVMYDNPGTPLLCSTGSDTKCTTGVQQRFDTGNVTCQCPLACLEKSFNVFQSMGVWPRNQYMVSGEIPTVKQS